MRKNTILFLLLSLLCSCEKEPLVSLSQGSMNLGLHIDTTSFMRDTNTHLDPTNPANYHLAILKGEKQVSYFESMADVPVPYYLFAGDYKLKAWYGEDLPAAFDNPYIYGELDYSIVDGKEPSVSIPCIVANAKVNVEFAPYFEDIYKSYDAVATTSFVEEPLVYGPTETRSGHFKVDSEGTFLEVSLRLTNLAGTSFTYKVPKTKMLARDNINYRFTGLNGDLFVNIQCDSTLTTVKLDTVLDNDYLPTTPPVLTPTNFVSGELISYVQNSEYAPFLYASATHSIDSCVLLLSNSAYLANHQLKSRYDLANLSQEDHDKLKQLGFVFDSKMRGKRNAIIQLQKVLSTLHVTLDQDPITFSVYIVDQSRDKNKSQQNDMVVEVLPKVEMLQAVNPMDCYIDRISMNVQKLEGELYRPFYLEYEDVNGWKDFPNQTYTEVDGNYAFELAGLPDGKKYRARVRYGTYRSEIIEMETEDIFEIPNPGFETWSMKEGGSNWDRWYPTGTSSDRNVWATLNERTCSHDNRLSYCSSSGTIPTDEGVNGTKAALLRTIAWGAGTTAAGSWSILKQVDAAQLYLGNVKSDNNPSYGVECSSRPQSVEFQYKYAPYRQGDQFACEIRLEHRSESGTTVIASNSFKKGGADNTYVKKSLLFEYTNTTLKPTHLVINFNSGTVVSNLKSNVKCGFMSDKPHVGSVLLIDDVKLTY